MAIWVDKNTKLIVQGITGSQGMFHAKGCRDYGTQVVGGVTPGKGGETVEGFKVFDSVGEAVKRTGANATMIFVPPPFAADAICEAADAGIALITCIKKCASSVQTARASSLLASARSASCPARFTKSGMSAWSHAPAL